MFATPVQRGRFIVLMTTLLFLVGSGLKAYAEHEVGEAADRLSLRAHSAFEETSLDTIRDLQAPAGTQDADPRYSPDTWPPVVAFLEEPGQLDEWGESDEGYRARYVAEAWLEEQYVTVVWTTQGVTVDTVSAANE